MRVTGGRNCRKERLRGARCLSVIGVVYNVRNGDGHPLARYRGDIVKRNIVVHYSRRRARHTAQLKLESTARGIEYLNGDLYLSSVIGFRDSGSTEKVLHTENGGNVFIEDVASAVASLVILNVDLDSRITACRLVAVFVKLYYGIRSVCIGLNVSVCGEITVCKS